MYFLDSRLLFHRQDVEAAGGADRWFAAAPKTWAASLKTITTDWANHLWPTPDIPDVTFDRIVRKFPAEGVTLVSENAQSSCLSVEQTYERFLIGAQILNKGRFAVIDRLHGGPPIFGGEDGAASRLRAHAFGFFSRSYPRCLDGHPPCSGRQQDWQDFSVLRHLDKYVSTGATGWIYRRS